MKEDLISLKTAKLAKEKGFDWITQWYYHPQYGIHYDSSYEDALLDHNEAEFVNKNTGNWANGYYSAPTQALLQKWLREEYNIDLEVKILTKGMDNIKSGYMVSVMYYGKSTNGFSKFDTYEEALEGGLYQGLKLIS